MPQPRPALVACGVFAGELSALPPASLGGAELVFVDSMLHMKPSLLGDRLGSILGAMADRPVALAFGDCCPFMAELDAAAGRARTPGANCCEIALGPERYRALRKRGSFFFLPEWAERWREIFELNLGLGDRSLARGLLSDAMRELVYLDTGVKPPPIELLGTISAYFGMPMSIERAYPEVLGSAVAAAIERARGTL